ncbi:MAG TPA: hypothetical protein VG944_24065, partial [Fimbriimonas sp.]|nr:hypothetical protein [Fimbriimonas sp.]
MTQEKAREFFSAYYEGSLERGLKQTFEQRLQVDAQIQGEYRAFCRTMDELDLLQYEEIEVPSYLSDRIATRLEAAQESRRAKSPWTIFLPRFAFGGIAAVAIIGGVMSWFSNSRASQAGYIPTVGNGAAHPPLETISVATDGTIKYTSATARTVQVLDDKGAVLRTFSLNANQELSTRLTNPNQASAALFEVRVSDQGPDERIAIPGNHATRPAKTQGTITEF